MFTGLLPIGTVVLLKENTKKMMIIGVCQKAVANNVIWDYAGCLYPIGYLGAEQVLLFNNEQIDKVFAVGYQDEEQFDFKQKADEFMEKLRYEELNHEKQ